MTRNVEVAKDGEGEEGEKLAHQIRWKKLEKPHDTRQK